jgi:hypothetical protein
MRAEDLNVDWGAAIVYVGYDFYQKTPYLPILHAYVPETISRFDKGARGGILISYDNGVSFEKLYDDSTYELFRGLTTVIIYQMKDGTVIVSPAQANAVTYNNVYASYILTVNL